MSKKQQRILLPASLIAFIVLTALAFAAPGKLRRLSVDSKSSSQPTSDPAKVKRAAYVRASALTPKLAWHLKAMGDRLERPGRERLRITGTLALVKDSQAKAVDAVLEFPDRLRLTIQNGAESRVITFDGDQVKASGSSLDTADQELGETLVYGTPEHFFSTQMQGMATRLLGLRFRLDDGSSAGYSGPYYDVYKVADRVRTATDQREQIKLYYFNSDTLLLERVTYEIMRNGATVKVEERLGNWTREQGQQVPRRIERFENGESVFVLAISTAGLSARADDGVFAN
jgi:hypothetical protein